ncbi:CD276 antigen-like isoform X2 [Hypomesus transpacificus]|uniref:CD276 antigen-like isoform X2 n=1 Tax=Hypomesus transpacificus TaxID=137520 RepID=UPI001F087A7D|nr:CD276 antigen-like isoform X2 [Hypomesus transpacificus]
MTLCHWARHFTQLALGEYPCYYSFEVTTPSRHVVAIRERAVMLGCSFSPDRSSGLKHLVIAWQRAEDSQVVHSFYYGADQLDKQSHQYRNRTVLFVSELEAGNASLMISGVRLGDAGLYLCAVSTLQGAHSATVQVDYAALYSEPRLSIQVNWTSVSVVYETEGYPEAQVQWEDSAGQQLVHQTQVSTLQEGLVFLRTQIVPLDNSKNTFNLTFILKNQNIKQILKRVVILNHAPCPERGSHKKAVITLSVGCAVLCVVVLGMCIQKKRTVRNLT